MPDYQGVGIGGSLLDCTASMFKSMGSRPRISTSNLAVVQGKRKSKSWLLMRHGMKNKSKTEIASLGRTSSFGRVTASFEYVGEPMPLDDAKKLYGKCMKGSADMVK